MIRLHSLAAGAALLAFVGVGLTFAADSAAPNDKSSVTAYMENDLFVRTDRYYTSGVQLTYLTKDLEAMRVPAALRKAGQWTPLFWHEGYYNNIGLGIGQQIFTPEDTNATNLIPNDRPYAGWFYGLLSLQHKNTRNLHVLELRAGVVGPSARGEQAQNGVHNLRDIPIAHGWRHQLHDEPGGVLTYEYKHRRAGSLFDTPFGADIIPSVRVSGGNVLTEAGVGATVRLGYNVPRDFHGSQIRTTGYAMPPEGGWPRKQPPFSLYVFGGSESRYVARNIFLDGNTWRDSHSVDREPWVGEMNFGAGLRLWGFRATYTQVYRTREFHEQHGDHHSFGSVSASVAF